MSAFSHSTAALLLAISVTTVSAAQAADAASKAKEASKFTASANQGFAQRFDLASAQDFEDAQRGLVAQIPDGVIKNAKGDMVWNGKQFEFIKGDAPDSVNPSLWRQEKLNNAAGLFKVAEGIWQVRGYDLANMTLVAGKTGFIHSVNRSFIVSSAFIP